MSSYHTERWTWDIDLCENNPADFPLVAWLALYGDKFMTPGGVVERLIDFVSKPLVLYAMNDAVIAVEAKNGIWEDLHAGVLNPSASQHHKFIQGDKVNKTWQISSPGCHVIRQVSVSGSVLPENDIRNKVLLGDLPTYSATGIMNIPASDHPFASRSWVVSMDQISSDIDHYFVFPSSGYGLLSSALLARSTRIIASFIRPLTPGI